MKLLQVMNVSRVFREIQDTRLPMKTAYKIAKFLKSAQTEIEFFQTRYQEILAEYKTKENVEVLENGDIKMPPEVAAEFNNEIDELAEIDTELDLEFTEAELEPCQLRVQQMMLLMPFIK